MKDVKDIYNVALVGCGWIGEDKHIPGLKANKDVKIRALCDIKPEKARRLAKLFKLEDVQIYSDYKEMLKDAQIDIVHVAVPNPWHCEITVAALNAKKHVLCEKPMAPTKAECEKMIEAARKNDRKLTVGFQWRYRPAALYVKEACKKGLLGDIYYVKGHALRYRAVPYWGEHITGNNAGGVLIDGAPHTLDLALWAIDNYEPYSVKAHTYNKMADFPEGNIWGEFPRKEFKVEDTGLAMITMKNGTTIFLEAAWAINQPCTDMTVTLAGTLAGLEMPGGGVRINGILNGKPYIQDADLSAPGAPFSIQPVEPMYRESQEFIKAIREDKAPFVKPEQAMVVSQIIEGIYESARTGKEVFF